MTEPSRRSIGALRAAFENRCPRCGVGRLLDGYLTPAPRCAECGVDLERHEAGDGAVFIVLTALCFVGVGATAALELTVRPPIWLTLSLVSALVIALTLALLPLVKRFLIAQALNLASRGEQERR